MRLFMALWFVWLAGTFSAFLVGLAAPNPDGPVGSPVAVASLIFSSVLMLTLAVWAGTREGAR